ncbi:21324_t:CDS:2 [Cetraspora pellucida]|uniref:21324_t:CDS:1 n=1 Tax=Cetraspora pellucida TaxID=1433469 RepID=A0A9N9C799_9GLOM|nr:21324_t:CDS:2 [Cetraspora pellucida]
MAWKRPHICLLTVIILLCFNLVNAQNEEVNAQDDVKPNDLTIEAIFDLMAISLIIFSIDAVHASSSRITKLNYFSLRMISYFFQSVILSLSIYFTIRIYQRTRDFFYIQYLITSLAFTAMNFIFDIIIKLEPDILSSSEFIVHLIFFILAIMKGYITNSSYLFILLPSLFVIFYPILVYLVGIIRGKAILPSRKDEGSTCTGRLVSVILAFIFGELMNRGLLEDDKIFPVMAAIKEKMRLGSVCAHFLFCLVVGSSVLWIKAYLTSLVIYASVDVKIRELRNKRNKNKHKVADENKNGSIPVV